MYFLHPCRELNCAFLSKPFQGANPGSAKFLFVGLDANYALNVEQNPIFDLLMEYLHDGVRFWKDHGVHHPFLLPDYSGDGRYYHKAFSRIGFCAEHAQDVSFVELLDVPTYARSRLIPSDLNADYLTRLNDINFAWFGALCIHF